MEYLHQQIRFTNLGLMLKRSIDALAEGYYLRLTNADSPLEGQIQGRDGLSALNGIALATFPVHSLVNFKDAIAGASVYFVGSGVSLYSGALTAPSAVSIPANVSANGSGKPLSFVAYRPSLDPYAWMYIGDSNRMLKVNRTAQAFQVGITPPAVAASVAVSAPTASFIIGGVALNGANFASWVGSVVSGGGSVALSQAVAEVIDVTMPGDNASPGSVTSLKMVSTIGSPASTTFDASLAFTANLSVIGGVSATDDDQIRLFLKVDTPTLYKEIRVYINVDASDPTFSKNYFLKVLQPSALTPAVGPTRTLVVDSISGAVSQKLSDQTGLMLDVSLDHGTPVIIDDFGPATSSWNAVATKRGSWTRIGNDQSRGWATVTGVRFEMVLADSATGTPTLQFYGFDIQGAAGLDTSVASAALYDWRYTYYSVNTGVESNPSPMMSTYTDVNGVNTYGVQAIKQVAVLTPTVSADPQVTHIRWYRRGGSLVQTWYQVGQQPNSGTFTDGASDASIEAAIPLSLTNDQPFTSTKPVAISTTLAGTVTTAPGFATVAVTSATNLQVGMVVSIGGGGTGKGEFVTIESVVGANITAYFANNHSAGEPLVSNSTAPVYGQALPYLWGPFQGFMMACGDPYRPGYLYWCNKQNPDAASAFNNIEITQPSDPLMNGLMYNQQPFAWSKEHLFMLSAGLAGTQTFIPYLTPCQRGLFAPWWFTIFDQIYFGAKDGIYSTQGGVATCLTDDLLWPIFHGQNSGPYYAVDFSLADANPEKYRAFTVGNEVRFVYPGTDGNIHQIAYNTLFKRWRPVEYNQVVPTCGYWQEEGASAEYIGSSLGTIFQSTGGTDGGNPIQVSVRPGSFNQGNLRDDKLYGDVMVDCDPGGGSITVTPYLNSEASSLTPVVITGSGRQQALISLKYVSGPPTTQGQFAKNISFDFAFNRTATATPILYGIDIAYLPRPERSQERATDWDNTGSLENKYFKSVVLEIDTFNQAITVLVQSDPEAAPVTQATLTVQTNGRQCVTMSFDAFYARLARILPTTALPWRIYNVAFVVDPDTSFVTAWDTNWTDAGYPFDKYVTGLKLFCDTQNVAKTIHVFKMKDDGTGSQEITGSPFTVTANGESALYVPFSTAVYTRLIRMYSLAADGVAAKLLSWQFIFDKEPLKIENFASNWTDGGWALAKRIKGIIIEGDTLGATKTVLLQGGPAAAPVTLATLLVTLNGRDVFEKGFSQVLGRMVRVWSTDSNPGKMYGFKLLFDPEPAYLTHSETQEGDLGIANYKHIPYANVEIRSTSPVTLTCVLDSARTYTYTINSTGGARLKLAVQFYADKFRLIKLSLDSGDGTTPFFVYGLECFVKPWNSFQGYQIVKEFSGGTA